MANGPASAPPLLGEERFTEDDQRAFAEISGDCNPMHMDAVAARRLMAGRPVVHGIHVFFRLLESFLQHGDGPEHAVLECTFSNPVCVGDTVQFRLATEPPGATVLEAVVKGLVCAHVVIKPADGPSTPAPVNPLEWPTSDAVPSALAALRRPLDEDPRTQVNRRYRVELPADLPTLFPRACGFLGSDAAAGIARLSYFIGMVCPGLHSVFASFTCRASKGNRHVDFLVRKYDARFRLVEVAFTGAIEGTMKAFLRPPPQVQESVQSLARLVQQGEFAGVRSLVVGGSRGLGELTAKLLAAGGGSVEITYAAGGDDAARIREEIAASGSGACAATQLDLASADLVQRTFAPGVPDLVFFYATPHIFRKKADDFDADVFREFCFFYVERFFTLCSRLEELSQGEKVLVYLPSTTAIVDRPRGILEYAMAKAAAEVLAEEVNRIFRSVRVISTRLPRLSTDQTATILGAAAESNVDTLLPIVRRMVTLARGSAATNSSASG